MTQSNLLIATKIKSNKIKILKLERHLIPINAKHNKYSIFMKSMSSLGK
jgi:hypothetical protein